MSAHPMQPRAHHALPPPRSCDWLEAAARLAERLGVTTGDMFAALLETGIQVVPDPGRRQPGSVAR